MSKFNIKVLALLNERSPKGFTEGDILATAKADFGASLGTARRAFRTFKRKKFIYPYVAKSETKIYRVSKYGKERINKYKLSSLFEQHLRNTTCLRPRKKTKLKDETNHAQIRIPKYPNSVLWKNILATLFYSPNNIVTMEDFKAVLGKGFLLMVNNASLDNHCLYREC